MQSRKILNYKSNCKVWKGIN